MPIFTASGRISSNTASICAPTTSGEISCTARTPQVFCAVMAVMTVFRVQTIRCDGLDIGLDARSAA